RQHHRAERPQLTLLDSGGRPGRKIFLPGRPTSASGLGTTFRNATRRLEPSVGPSEVSSEISVGGLEMRCLFPVLVGTLFLAIPKVESSDPKVSGQRAQSDKRVDAAGDPLPAQALLRLGTLRLRGSEDSISAAISPDRKHVVTGLPEAR